MRRGLGRGRSLIVVGAVLALISVPLAWRKAGGIVLDVSTDWGFRGGGLIMFVAAALMLILVVLPYTTETRRFVLDRPLAYALLLVVAVGGLLLALVDVLGGDEDYSLMPLDAPGLWLAIGAMAITTWGVLEMMAERPPPP